jgi:predicted Zn-dependent protease
MPQSWTEKLGSVVEQDIVGGARDCDAEAGVQVLDRLVGRLTAGMDPVPDLKVRVVDRKMVNAFAAPGGRVVIMGGLIGKAEKAEEVAGVLAHEVGHVLERHPTINAIRVFGLMTLIDLVMGDSSTVLETLGQAGGLLLLTAYSREDERAADEHALSILAAAGIDAGGLARFFDRLAKKDKDVPEFLSYIASHPKLADRRALAEAASGQGRSPALNDADWKALKEICGVKK